MIDANHTSLAPRRLPAYTYPALFLIFWMIAVGHFDKWSSFVWMGDDLIFHHSFQIGTFASTPWQVIGEAFLENIGPSPISIFFCRCRRSVMTFPCTC